MPSVSTAKLGTPQLSSATVRDSKGAAPDAARCSTTISASSRSAASAVISASRRFSSVAVDHQHRQRAHPAQIGPGQPGRRQRRRRGHPHPGPAPLGQLTFEFVRVLRISLGQYRFGEGVAIGTAQRDARVRQVGVDREVAVARLVGAAAGGGHAGAGQRDHQLARQRPGRRFRRRYHLGHGHRANIFVAQSNPHSSGETEPAVGRVVQRPRQVLGVHGAGPVVQQRETAADDGVAHLADRHGARHRTRPAQPQQPILAGELIDGGAAVHPAHAVPQRQCLCVAQYFADSAPCDQPLAQRSAVRPHLRRRFRRAHHRTLGQQMPRALALRGVGRVFVIDGEFVAHPPVRDRFTSVVHQRHHRPATGRADRQPVVLVLDLVPGQRLPAGPLARGNQAVAAPAQRSDVAGQPGDRPPVVLDHRGQLGTVGVAQPHPRGQRWVDPRRDDVGALLRQGFQTTTSPPIAPDSNASELSRAARPSSQESRQPVSRSR